MEWETQLEQMKLLFLITSCTFLFLKHQITTINKKTQCLNLILYYGHFSDYLKTFTQVYLRGVFSQLILVNWESVVRWQWRRGK